MTKEEIKKAKSEAILKRLIDHPRLAWNTKIVMPSDKKVKRKD